MDLFPSLGSMYWRLKRELSCWTSDNYHRDDCKWELEQQQEVHFTIYSNLSSSSTLAFACLCGKMSETCPAFRHFYAIFLCLAWLVSGSHDAQFCATGSIWSDNHSKTACLIESNHQWFRWADLMPIHRRRIHTVVGHRTSLTFDCLDSTKFFGLLSDAQTDNYFPCLRRIGKSA